MPFFSKAFHYQTNYHKPYPSSPFKPYTRFH